MSSTLSLSTWYVYNVLHHGVYIIIINVIIRTGEESVPVDEGSERQRLFRGSNTGLDAPDLTGFDVHAQAGLLSP